MRNYLSEAIGKLGVGNRIGRIGWRGRRLAIRLRAALGIATNVGKTVPAPGAPSFLQEHVENPRCSDYLLKRRWALKTKKGPR